MEMCLRLYLWAIAEVSVHVSYDLFVSKEQIAFDIEAIDKAIESFDKEIQLYQNRWEKSNDPWMIEHIVKATLRKIEITIVTGNKAKEMGLSTYHSFSLKHGKKAERETIEKLVLKDGAQALDKDVEYRNGQLYYGFFTLKPVKNNKRYIFYLNQNLANKSPWNIVTVIYMEGKKSPEEVKKLIRK